MKAFLFPTLTLTLTILLTSPILGQNPNEIDPDGTSSEAFKTLEKNISSFILSLTPNPPVTPPNTVMLMVEETQGEGEGAGQGNGQGGGQVDGQVDGQGGDLGDLNPNTQTLPVPTAKDVSESGTISATPISTPQGLQILTILEDAGLLGQSKKYYGEAQQRTQELPIPPENAKSIVTSLTETPKRGVKLGLTVTQNPWFLYYEINPLSFQEAKKLLEILSNSIDPESVSGLQEMLSKLETFKN